MDVQELKAQHKLLKDYTYQPGEIDRGYNNRTLYVNLSDNTISEKPVSEEMKKNLSGERDSACTCSGMGPSPKHIGTILRTRLSFPRALWLESHSIPGPGSLLVSFFRRSRIWS